MESVMLFKVVVVVLALLINVTSGARLVTFTNNPEKWRSLKGQARNPRAAGILGPERFLDLQPGHSLELVQRDTEQTKRDTQTSKYKLTWNGVEVLESSLVHIMHGDQMNETISGQILKDINEDIDSPVPKLTKEDAAKIAIETVNQTASEKVFQLNATNEKELCLYVMFHSPDNGTHVARLVYRAAVSTLTNGTLTRNRIYIEANTGEVLKVENDLLSYRMRAAGGNINTGMYIMGEGWWEDKKLEVEGCPGCTNCTLQNTYVTVSDMGGVYPAQSVQDCFKTGPIIEVCDPPPGEMDSHQSYSQRHDALLYATEFVKMMENVFLDYTIQDNCGRIKVCINFGENLDNAYFVNAGHCESYYGSGFTLPGMATRDMIPHELGHGITEHTSGMLHEQAGAMMEAFSDLCAEMFKAYFFHKDSAWKFGETNANYASDDALRYMYNPPLDGKSIDCTQDYTNNMDNHRANGVYNKASYILVSQKHWSLRSVFELFLRANKMYWNSFTGFDEGLCGLMMAAMDLGYNVHGLQDAFAQVGVFCFCPMGWLTRTRYLVNETLPNANRTKITSCYKVMNLSVPWITAKEHCKNMNSVLLRVSDNAELSWITSVLSMETNENGYWVGANETDPYGRLASQSEFIDSVNLCAAFTSANQEYKVKAEDCTQEKLFICEMSCCDKACRRNGGA